MKRNIIFIFLRSDIIFCILCLLKKNRFWFLRKCGKIRKEFMWEGLSQDQLITVANVFVCRREDNKNLINQLKCFYIWSLISQRLIDINWVIEFDCWFCRLRYKLYVVIFIEHSSCKHFKILSRQYRISIKVFKNII